MTSTITDAVALAWFDQFKVIAGDRLCPEMALIFADFLESEHGLDSWAECLRWMVAEGKRPFTDLDASIYFWAWTGVFGGVSDIPERLAKEIGIDDGMEYCTIDFPTPQAAILAVMKVWHLREAGE